MISSDVVEGKLRVGIMMLIIKMMMMMMIKMKIVRYPFKVAHADNSDCLDAIIDSFVSYKKSIKLIEIRH